MNRAEALVALEGEFGVLLRRVRRVIGERARAVHPDLQPATYLMLGTIAERGPVRASVLAELFEIDKGAVSRQVTQLLELGLIARETDQADARASLLSVTTSGASSLEQVASQRRAFVDGQLAAWSAEDLELFVTQLGRYNAALNAGVD